MGKVLEGIGAKLETKTKRERTPTKLCYGGKYLAGQS